MGAAASVDIPDELDVHTFKQLAGDRFSQDLFDEREQSLHS
jgi:hypothetical protein